MGCPVQSLYPSSVCLAKACLISVSLLSLGTACGRPRSLILTLSLSFYSNQQIQSHRHTHTHTHHETQGAHHKVRVLRNLDWTFFSSMPQSVLKMLCCFIQNWRNLWKIVNVFAKMSRKSNKNEQTLDWTKKEMIVSSDLRRIFVYWYQISVEEGVTVRHLSWIWCLYCVSTVCCCVVSFKIENFSSKTVMSLRKFLHKLEKLD